MKKYLFFVMGIAMPIFFLNAQTPPPKILTIGDTVPEIVFSKILNYKTSSAKLSDFRGKIVVLDFWATWCPPCVEGLPKLSKLQQQFPDQLIVLPVDFGEFGESEVKILNFLNKRKEINLPSIYDKEKNLTKYFSFAGIPHCVVLDEHHVVQAITTGDYVDEAYITALLKGEHPSIYFKNDIVDWFRGDPLSKARGAETATEYRSLMTGHIPGLFIDDNWEDSGRFKMTLANFSIPQLYARAFQKEDYMFSRVRVESDSAIEKYFGPERTEKKKYEQWLAANTYCYELLLPVSLKDKRFEIMLGELNNYFGARFGINGRLEKRKVPCYMLIRSASKEVIKQKCLEEKKLLHHNVGQIELMNTTADQIVKLLTTKNRSKPILNGTDLDFPVTVVIKGGNLSDMEDVNKHLNRIGLAVIEVIADVEMIIL